MSFSQLGALLWAGRLRLLLCTLAALAGTLAVSLSLPKSYEAKARVLLEVMQEDLVNGVSYNIKAIEPYVRTQQLLATSERVSEAVIGKLGWTENPTVIEQWTAQTGGVGDIKAWAAQRLLGQIGAYPLEGTGTMEIVYRAPDPQAAEVIVSAIREAYIETVLALQTEAATRRADRFRTLLVEARAKLTAAEAALTLAQRETGTVLDGSGRDIRERALGQIGDTALAARLAADRQSERASISMAEGQAALLRRRLLGVEQQIAQAGLVAGTENPEYQTLLDRRALLGAQISQAQSAARAAAFAAAAAAQRNAAQPEADYQAERSRVLGRAEENLRIAQAGRLADLQRGEVKRLEFNLATSLEAAARTESGLVVMGDVITNQEPVAPNIPLNALLASLFGLGLGFASVLIDGLWRREVLGTDDLASAAGVPVLAVLSSRPPSSMARLWQRLAGLWRPARRRDAVAA